MPAVAKMVPRIGPNGTAPGIRGGRPRRANAAIWKGADAHAQEEKDDFDAREGRGIAF